MMSDLGSKGPVFDPRAVSKIECIFVNIYNYYVVSVLYYVFDCCFGLYSC